MAGIVNGTLKYDCPKDSIISDFRGVVIEDSSLYYSDVCPEIKQEYEELVCAAFMLNNAAVKKKEEKKRGVEVSVI